MISKSHATFVLLGRTHIPSQYSFHVDWWLARFAAVKEVQVEIVEEVVSSEANRLAKQHVLGNLALNNMFVLPSMWRVVRNVHGSYVPSRHRLLYVRVNAMHESGDP